MAQTSEVVKCLKCKRILDEPTHLTEVERKPCPACGSLSRHIETTMEDYKEHRQGKP